MHEPQHAAGVGNGDGDDHEPSQMLRIVFCLVLEVFTYSLLFFKHLHYLQSV